MDYVNLGRTGVKVSPLCLGTMNFGPRTSEDDSITMIHEAIDRGINFIDTANFYGQPLNDGKGQGTTERIVGKALAGKRDRVVLATKVFAQTADYPEDPNAYGLSRRHIIAECEQSLRRLNTDYIDLYQLHRPFRHVVPIDETLRALDDLIRSGKVRYIGTSQFPSWQITEAIWTSKELRLNRFVTEQVRYSIFFRGIEREVVPMAQAYDVAILPYSPLAGGILTGKYQRDGTVPEGTRMAYDEWAYWAKSFLFEGVFDALDALGDIADQKQCSMSQLALGWAMNQPAITSVIIGPRTMEQLEDNLGAVAVEISEEDQERINEIAPLRGD